MGVEGVSDEVIINAIRKSGAEIIGEENNIPERKITKADLFVLGLTGTENSEINRKKILKKTRSAVISFNKRIFDRN